jgi:hypothetical protein
MAVGLLCAGEGVAAAVIAAVGMVENILVPVVPMVVLLLMHINAWLCIVVVGLSVPLVPV